MPARNTAPQPLLLTYHIARTPKTMAGAGKSAPPNVGISNGDAFENAVLGVPLIIMQPWHSLHGVSVDTTP